MKYLKIRLQKLVLYTLTQSIDNTEYFHKIIYIWLLIKSRLPFQTRMKYRFLKSLWNVAINDTYIFCLSVDNKVPRKESQQILWVCVGKEERGLSQCVHNNKIQIQNKCKEQKILSDNATSLYITLQWLFLLETWPMKPYIIRTLPFLL